MHGCVCPVSMPYLGNIASDITGRNPVCILLSRVIFFLINIKVHEIGWKHFVISETLSSGDNRC